MRRNPPLTREQAAAILSLPIDASPNEARSEYRRLAKTHHPDVGGDASVFRRVSEAYEVMRRPFTGPTPRRVQESAWRVVRPGGRSPLDFYAELLPGEDPEEMRLQVEARTGPYSTTLLELLLDIDEGRDYFSGPRPPAPRSVWEEDE